MRAVSLVALLSLYLVSARPASDQIQVFQSGQVQKFVPEGRVLVAPDCTSVLSQSLPECQISPYGGVWGDIVVSVESPVLKVVEPKDRKKKRKQQKLANSAAI